MSIRKLTIVDQGSNETLDLRFTPAERELLRMTGVNLPECSDLIRRALLGHAKQHVNRLLRDVSDEQRRNNLQYE